MKFLKRKKNDKKCNLSNLIRQTYKTEDKCFKMDLKVPHHFVNLTFCRKIILKLNSKAGQSMGDKGKGKVKKYLRLG